MLSTLYSAGISGVDGYKVTVECDVRPSDKDDFQVVGLPDAAVKEAKKEFGIDVYSVVTMNDIIEAIEEGVIEGKEHLPKMYEYRSQYGA